MRLEHSELIRVEREEVDARIYILYYTLLEHVRSLLFTTFRRVSFTLREISIAATVHNLSSPSLDTFRREKDERIFLSRSTGTTTQLIYRIWHFVSSSCSVIGGTFLRKNVNDTRSIHADSSMKLA